MSIQLMGCRGPRTSTTCVVEFQSTGLPQAESESQAAVRLGAEDVLAASSIARPELHSWARRLPWVACVVIPFVRQAVEFVLWVCLASCVAPACPFCSIDARGRRSILFFRSHFGDDSTSSRPSSVGL